MVLALWEDLQKAPGQELQSTLLNLPASSLDRLGHERETEKPWCESAEGRRTSSFKEAKEGKRGWPQRPQLKLATSQTHPTGAGKGKGTSTLTPNYPLHCCFPSLPLPSIPVRSYYRAKEARNGVRVLLYSPPRWRTPQPSGQTAQFGTWLGKQAPAKERLPLSSSSGSNMVGGTVPTFP